MYLYINSVLQCLYLKRMFISQSSAFCKFNELTIDQHLIKADYVGTIKTFRCVLFRFYFDVTINSVNS